jgi:glycerol-3-phosphate acyltransferase PlsX
MIRIALDAMGGDHAPREIVRGAAKALREHELELVLVGPGDILPRELKKYKPDRSRISIYEANDVVTMEDNPTSAMRRKKDSSIAAGMNLLNSGQVSAFVSAGNTGAIVMTALLTLGKQEGIERPALGIVLPAPSASVLFLDVGANADCRPSFLLQFAYMGSIYVQRAYGIENPRVGLLSNGEEATKGNKLVREAHQLLKESDLNFIGNVESRDIPKGIADVVVTDGFTGNVVVKSAEGIGEIFLSMSKLKATDHRYRKSVSLLMRPALKAAEGRLLDYSGHGVALLLGVKGSVIVAHGRSEAEGIKRAIAVAKQVVEQEALVALGC